MKQGGNQKINLPLSWIIRDADAEVIWPAVVDVIELSIADPPPDPLPIKAPVPIAY